MQTAQCVRSFRRAKEAVLAQKRAAGRQSKCCFLLFSIVFRWPMRLPMQK